VTRSRASRSIMEAFRPMIRKIFLALTLGGAVERFEANNYYPKAQQLQARAEETSESVFFVNFSDPEQVLSFYDIDVEHLHTEGSSACTEADHVRIGSAMSGDNAGQRTGTIFVMDNINATCGKAEIATGHLSGKKYMSYGTYAWRVRFAYAPEEAEEEEGGPSPEALVANAMSCVSLYTSRKLHQEFAACTRASHPGEITLNYWHGDGIREWSRVPLRPDANSSFTDLKLEWTPERMRYFLNGVLAWERKNGTDGKGLPQENMNQRLILRPTNSTYAGRACAMALATMSYTPLPSPSGSVTEIPTSNGSLLVLVLGIAFALLFFGTLVFCVQRRRRVDDHAATIIPQECEEECGEELEEDDPMVEMGQLAT